jgi:antitoxin MazE
MRIKVVSVGNSKGIRIPRAILQQCSIGDEIELEVKDRCIALKPVKPIRSGWEDAFRKMHDRGDDQLLEEPEAHAPTRWDRTKWKW